MKEKNEDRVIKLIRLQGEVFEDKTLKDLQEQAGPNDSFDSLVIEIASPGGSVSEGLAIMVWLDELSQSGKQIISIVVANAYSIASLIMLAADYRLISKHGKVMVHNPMIPKLSYTNADELEKYANELRQLESVMYELYQIFTGLSKDEIKVLMDKETYLTPQDAVKNGFADKVVDIKPQSFQMTTINNKTINMSKTLNILNRVISMVSKSDFVNQLYYDDKGGEIEIFQNDPATYKVGDRTNVENSDEVVLADGAKLKIEDFIITEINKDVDEVIEDEGAKPTVDGEEKSVEEIVEETIIEEPVKETQEDDSAKKSKGDMPTKVIEKTESVTTTKETIAAKISEVHKWEFETVQDTFEIGMLIEYKPADGNGEPFAVSAGEYLLEDGRKVLVDSDGIIQFIKEAPGAEVTEAKEDEKEVVSPNAKAKEDEDKKDAKAGEFNKGAAPKEDAKAKEHEDDEDAKAKKEDEDLKAILASMKVSMKEMEDEIKALKDDSEAKFKSLDKFENLATEAIDKIAENTVSNFKPSAKVNIEATPVVNTGGSIFQKLRKKANL